MANDAFRCGLAATDVHEEPHDQAGEVEAPVESVGERAEVSVRVLAVPEGLVGTDLITLAVADYLAKLK